MIVKPLLGSNVPCGVIRSPVNVRIYASGVTWAKVQARFGATPVRGTTYQLADVVIVGASHQHLAVHHQDGKIEVLARALWEYQKTNQDAQALKFTGPVLRTDTHIYVLALPDDIVDSGIVINDWHIAIADAQGSGDTP